MEHPKVLEDEDFTYYHSIQDNSVDELYLSFSTTRLNPWTHKPEEIFLSTNRELEISEANKVSLILSCLIFSKDVKLTMLFTTFFFQNASSQPTLVLESPGIQFSPVFLR